MAAPPSTDPIHPRSSRRVLGTAPKPSRQTNAPPLLISPSVYELSLTSASAAGNADALVCPICSEDMMTLLQLNRHLDDIHIEASPLERSDISSWFHKRMQKAKSFQPVVVLNQKFKGLDVFESNDFGFSPPGSPTPPQQSQAQQSQARPLPTRQTTDDSDLYVSRDHWQKSYGDDLCLDPGCQRPLGIVNGCINCRKCGKLFCEEHTQYLIRLSRSAQHEPVRGYWSRVCETCYKSRKGYNDHHGVIVDHTEEFRKARARKVGRACLEVARLEKRLTKLTQMLTNPPPPPTDREGKLIKGLSKKPLLQNHRRAMEQSIVTWEDDKKVTNCPYCAQTFSRFSQPKHHCRLCGKVVCGDPRTACSKEISLDVAPAPTAAAPKGTTIGVRICAPCTTTLFSNRDFATSLLSDPPAYVRAYATLFSFQTGITEQLPRFQRLVDAIASSPGDRQGVVEGVRMKKRIVETLAKVDGVAKTIGDCMGDGAEERLRRNILAATGNWGRNVGLRVKAATAVLDDVIIRTRPTARDEVMARLGKPGVGRATTAVTKMVIEAEPVVEETEADRDEKTRDVVVVLEEQKFLVLGMMEEARKRRRFDEVEALGRSLDEIVAEVERLGGAVVGV